MRHALRSTFAATLLVALAVPVFAAENTSEKISYSTYRERDGNVSLFVDGYLASRHVDDAYIPVPIAVGMLGGGDGFTVTPASFVLVDAAGQRYPAAEFATLRRDYPHQLFDLTVLRARPLVVGLPYSDLFYIRSNFYPPPGRGLRIDQVSIGSSSWFSDVLYFPRPASLAGTLTLEMTAAGRHGTLSTRFAVPVAAPKHAANG
jgi:hypothetical protein